MMKEQIKNADSKFCRKLSEQSPVKIGFTLGVVINAPLLFVLFGVGTL